MQPWYENPQWVAIILTAAVSILSLAFTLSTIGLSRRTRRATIEQSLIKQRNDINEAFARHALRGPFATILEIPDDELKQFVPRTNLLFLQINLLEDVYQNRQLLEYKRLTIHEAWAKNILTPWINSDPNLIRVLRHVYQTNDIMDPGFVAWLRTLITIRSTT